MKVCKYCLKSIEKPTCRIPEHSPTTVPNFKWKVEFFIKKFKVIMTSYGLEVICVKGPRSSMGKFFINFLLKIKGRKNYTCFTFYFSRSDLFMTNFKSFYEREKKDLLVELEKIKLQ